MSARSRHVSPRPDRAGRAHALVRLRDIRNHPLLAVTALASLGAGVVHAAVAPEHSNWWASVVFFVGLAAFQIGWAGYLLFAQPVRAALVLGAAVNAVALGTWLVSRTSGMPFGPHRGVAEPAARADVIASVLGVLVIVGATGLALGIALRPSTRLGPILSTGAGGLAVSALSVVALTGVSGHAHSLDEHGHRAHPANVQAAGATAQLTPAAAMAQCRRTAQVSTDATFAKTVAAVGGNAAAITKAEKAAKKQLKRALAKCGGLPDAAPAPAKASPHPDDGHSH